jgi:hypothetical protein
VAVYIADAPAEELPLVGGGTHDWAYLLGPGVWDALDDAASVAQAVHVAGATTVAVAVTWCLAMPALHARGRVPVAPRRAWTPDGWRVPGTPGDPRER